MANEGILLESGTNEVEILEFTLGGQSFGVNVLKIQAIEQFEPDRVTQIQLSHPAVVGTLLFRESCITLVELAQELGTTPVPVSEQCPSELAEVIEHIAPNCEPLDSVENEDDDGFPKADSDNKETGNLILVMEFNDLKTAFVVDGVNRIHRISWEDISPLSAFLSDTDTKFTGSMNMDGREILIIDMEKVVTDILPSGQNLFPVEVDSSHPNFAKRKSMTIFLAEDSGVIKKRVVQELAHGNYINVKAFANGKECYDAIVAEQKQAVAQDKPITDFINGIISDIEMPAMDGLALCRNIKNTLNIKDVPVIMFSSLINDQIARKCEDVGADDYISKPQFDQLVTLLDHHCIELKVTS